MIQKNILTTSFLSKRDIAENHLFYSHFGYYDETGRSFPNRNEWKKKLIGKLHVPFQIFMSFQTIEILTDDMQQTTTKKLKVAITIYFGTSHFRLPPLLLFSGPLIPPHFSLFLDFCPYFSPFLTVFCSPSLLALIKLKGRGIPSCPLLATALGG